jgi:diguanylate cyclase (GGDEF)-like protein/PAS domain S-box-containing protein
MSLAGPAGTAAAGVVVAAATAAVLWFASSRHDGPVQRAYRWFTVAAVAWGAGFVAQQALAGPLGETAVPLTVGDLPSLPALLAMVAGLGALASARPEAAAAAPAPGVAMKRLADGYVLAAALFVIGWVTLFGSIYQESGERAGTFALALAHPLADLAVLGMVLPSAVIAGKPGLAPFLAVAAVAASDALAVEAKIDAASPGLWAELLLLSAFGLLAAIPLINSRLARPPPHRPMAAARPLGRHRQAGDAGMTALVATLAAATAAVVIISWALAGGSAIEPAVALAGGLAVLALAARTTGLIVREKAVIVTQLQAGHHFRELSERITDMVLVCDFDGTIRYASPAVSEYGYSPEKLAGMTFADLIHPEDLPAVIRFARAAARRPPAADRFPCRVRASDGTWRYTESTVSRYQEAGEPDQLLVTARDVSEQVALRGQVTHLTFHDGLTGLPNRTYLEQRAKDLLGGGLPPAADLAAAELVAAEPAAAGVILLDLDGFAGVNDTVGHGGGDLLLTQAARRIRAAVPPHDTVARWGGDEFAVLAENANGAQKIVDIGERLAASIAATAFHVAGRDVSLTASVGVAIADGDDPGDLLRNADVAMSRAKQAGGRVEVFGRSHPPA